MPNPPGTPLVVIMMPGVRGKEVETVAIKGPIQAELEAIALRIGFASLQGGRTPRLGSGALDIDSLKVHKGMEAAHIQGSGSEHYPGVTRGCRRWRGRVYGSR